MPKQGVHSNVADMGCHSPSEPPSMRFVLRIRKERKKGGQSTSRARARHNPALDLFRNNKLALVYYQSWARVVISAPTDSPSVLGGYDTYPIWRVNHPPPKSSFVISPTTSNALF